MEPAAETSSAPGQAGAPSSTGSTDGRTRRRGAAAVAQLERVATVVVDRARDALARRRHRRSARAEAARAGVAVERTVTIARPIDDVDRLVGDADAFARAMAHVARLEPREDRLRWVVHAGAERALAWDTRVVEHVSRHHLRWQTVDGPPLPHEGELRLREAPAGRGTEVTFRLHFHPSRLGLASIGRRLGLPLELLVGEALRRLKALAESGEIPSLDRNPSARANGGKANGAGPGGARASVSTGP
jgi:uncharacterized membrane protein